MSRKAEIVHGSLKINNYTIGYQLGNNYVISLLWLETALNSLGFKNVGFFIKQFKNNKLYTRKKLENLITKKEAKKLNPSRRTNP